ncbi:uncharacterized protein AB675_2074 [Cyphellophora attinorum]|uniref:Uncharacterized protein n=1 Tax=Cyphellophora attinorum TaxID=1664694 RepID=A0A0N1H827_9EURO|nr:uncharacterized protein AB675_2074 [Phialophora attinorum]KPI42935.1 hypothetical protein AB675_2074 [Phialophora attinorum]
MNQRLLNTACPEESIWSPLGENTFRQVAVELALATGECPWDADIGLIPLNGKQQADLLPESVLPLNQKLYRSLYKLPYTIEARLASDCAFIAANQEAVFSVTAVCIEQSLDSDGHLTGLTLRFAANEGINDELKGSMQSILQALSCSAITRDQAVDVVFAQIVSLNRSRVLQRVRKAVGHPPIFREKGRTRTNPDDRLLRAFQRMQKSKLTSAGHRLIERGLEVNASLLAFLKDITIEDTQHGTDDVLHRLQDISRNCYEVTTDKGRTPFKELLVESGLNAHLWLKSKYVGEVDKIGAYWRIANSLVEIFQWLHSQREPGLGPLSLAMEVVQPYVSVTREPSIQGRPMRVYVHAEIQLLCHYLEMERQSDVAGSRGPRSGHTTNLPPRVVGASKSACFLCFLCLKSHGGLIPPPTHGRLYDQWTIPDLAEYAPQQVQALRQTIARMSDAMMRIRAEYSLKRQRDHPMTSRVDIDRLSVFPLHDEEASTLEAGADRNLTNDNGSMVDETQHQTAVKASSRQNDDKLSSPAEESTGHSVKCGFRHLSALLHSIRTALGRMTARKSPRREDNLHEVAAT